MPTPTWAADRALWRKSTRSGGAQQCVELATLPTGTAIRDSKHPRNPLRFDPDAFATFICAIQDGTLGAPLPA